VCPEGQSIDDGLLDVMRNASAFVDYVPLSILSLACIELFRAVLALDQCPVMTFVAKHVKMLSNV
jgi:uncharacterized membrane protein YecN with MAPEG domain